MGYREDFIAKLAPMAQEDNMLTGVPACITLAQGGLESNWGRSGLSTKGNNLFGVKGKPGGLYPTKEQNRDGSWVTIMAWFRHYDSWYESVKHHSLVLLNSKFPNGSKRYISIVGERDYKRAANILVAGGYATDHAYATLLIDIIEQYGLMKYNTFDLKEDLSMSIQESLSKDAPATQEFMLKELSDNVREYYRKGFISDYGWAKKASEGKLTLGDMVFLQGRAIKELAKAVSDVREG